MKTLGRWMTPLLAIPVVLIGLLASCQSKLIYFPRPYGEGITAAWQKATGGKPVDFRTSQGSQRAFLQGNLKSPRNLWVVVGGNGTIALDWSDWLTEHAPKQDAWLLVDFPGYGDCQGKPTPGRIRESIRTVVPVATGALGGSGDPDPRRLRLVGHSLGASASMLAASEFGIQRGVLLTPFTSTMDMSRHMTGLPIGFLIWHRLDNSARLAELAKRGPGEVIIFHGTDDESIPVKMSRTLAARYPDIVRFTEIPGGRHNTLQETNAEQIAAALEKIGKP